MSTIEQPTFAETTGRIGRRAWNDLEPKIGGALASGAAVNMLVEVLSEYGVHLTATAVGGLTWLAMVLAGYFTPSTR